MVFNFFKELFGKTPQPEPISAPTEKTGLIKISGCDNPKRKGNIIFVHGLGGDARKTWHPEELDNDDNFWPMWLGKERPDLGIWSFGYNAAPFEWKGQTMPLFDRASNLLKYLAVNDIGERPIIFITHSMGGLLVKEMLRNAQTFNKKTNNKKVIEQTKGIVFLSTPHTGSHLANLVTNIGTFTRNTISVEELKSHIPQLRQLNEWYRQNVDVMEIATEVYYETKPIFTILVVDPDSANPNIQDVQPTATDDDHISITKPKSPNNLVYKGVSRFIKEQLSIIPQEIKNNLQNISAPILSNIYIARPEIEDKCFQSILQPKALIRIKSPHKMGKTHLMSRIFDHVKQKGYKTVSINLWSKEYFADLNTFLQSFCTILSLELGLKEKIDEFWNKRLSSQTNCTNYLKKYLLSNIDSPLVLGLDNIDEIFPYTEITQQFSALLRAWNENPNNEESLQNLRLIISYSQDVYVSLNVNQSPFNVGIPVEIGEFNNTQTKELVKQYGLNWSDTEINQLRAMSDGHPYLLTTALDKITKNNLTLEQFIKIAPTDESPYRSFLTDILQQLENDSLLKTAMQQVIKSDVSIQIDSTQAFKLRSLGLIEFQGNKVQCLCNLYRLYFQERLS
ncbi:AAA-like domain-containing protein [Anabaena sp. UHCC 0451]|uniref:AAA-like domain-containing protein n=1 Tax=Anabaena sp. UHCC 0451 TaxID=2055235 RepID=UPI002B217335|nr:AAA-like domain-containing protein [Anabaena sp. UHCC 0451]MEA5578851.1 AAA-like domain-containing protein [Anabaena sp. UHCC 0451]